MRSYAIIVAGAIAGLYSCGQNKKSASDATDAKILDLARNRQSQSLPDKYVYTAYNYADSSSAHLLIQNSVPKSGINYTAPDGRKYIYTVFWTRIVNKTANALELNIRFPADSFEIPVASGNYIKLFIPADTMNSAKESLLDYGLNVKSFLDISIRKSSSLKRIIHPKESSSFYVVPLSNRGVGSALRTSLSLRGQKLVYKINNKEIDCGQVNLKNLVLQK